jgi:hypothetical protein
MGEFNTIGYFLEYFVNSKYIGSKSIQIKDTNIIFGYASKQSGIAEEDIILDRNKKIKKGQKYHTYLQKLQGKYIR